MIGAQLLADASTGQYVVLIVPGAVAAVILWLIGAYFARKWRRNADGK